MFIFFLYNTQDIHLKVRNEDFEFIIQHKNDFYYYFQEDLEDSQSLEDSFNNYIIHILFIYYIYM